MKEFAVVALFVLSPLIFALPGVFLRWLSDLWDRYLLWREGNTWR